MKKKPKKSEANPLESKAVQDVFKGAEFILSLFNRMEDAEKVIAAKEKEYPEHKKLIHEAFRLCCPSRALRDTTQKVYQAHVAELCDRLVGGKDTTLPTAAEIVMVMNRVSTETPMRPEGQLIYMEAFGKIFPDWVKEVREDIVHLKAVTKGSVESEREWIYQRLVVKGRKL